MENHCTVFALSDPKDPQLRQRCLHNHSQRCEQCDALALAVNDAEGELLQVPFSNTDERDEALYLFQIAKAAIQAWKCHQLRSVRQDEARLDALDFIDNRTVLIVNDWAMKFIPQMYRESQADWFGKRRISWHISVVYRRVCGELQSQGFIHIVQSCSQGSAAVVTIMQHVLQTLKSEHPEVEEAFFRQDNAGCYHSAITVLACPTIEASTLVKVRGIDFSDPLGGKGAADRLAATAKSHIRIFINEGNDVTTAEQMRDALLSHGGIEGVRVAVTESLPEELPAETPVQDGEKPEKPKIPGIRTLNNCRFTNGNLVAWKAYGIGSGKEVKMNPNQGKQLTFCPSLM